MKISKQFLIAGAMLCAITTTGAHAVTKCFALNTGLRTACTTDPFQYEYRTDWAATCTTNGVSTPISGIGICSSTDGGSPGATATELDISSTVDENLNCWCRMISPAVSRWVFYLWFGSAGDCAWECARYCASSVQFVEDFRSAMLGSLSD